MSALGLSYTPTHFCAEACAGLRNNFSDPSPFSISVVPQQKKVGEGHHPHGRPANKVPRQDVDKRSSITFFTTFLVTLSETLVSLFGHVLITCWSLSSRTPFARLQFTATTSQLACSQIHMLITMHSYKQVLIAIPANTSARPILWQNCSSEGITSWADSTWIPCWC